MKTLLTMAAFVLTGIYAVAQQQVGIDKILPSLEQLGAGWQSNSIVVLVDPLSSPSVVTNEGAGWLRGAQSMVGTNGCEAHGVIRCFHGSHSHLVWINRFKSQERIRADWGTDKQSRTKLDMLPSVGDEVRFYQRHGMHNNLAFRRGNFLIDVEGPNTEIEPLIEMAKAIDRNLLKLGEAHAR